MNKLPQKINASSMQVIKTLQTLLQGDYTMIELTRILNKDETYPIFNRSVVSKYINTCRYCGIDIPRIGSRYYVSYIPFGMDLSSEDAELLNNIQDIVKSEMSVKSFRLFDKFMDKLNRFSNRKIVKVEPTKFTLSSELFERAITQHKKVRLLFKNKDVMDCIPLKLIAKNGKQYFKVYYVRELMIDISRLSGIEILSDKYIDKFGGELSVIFKLKGALAKRYEARENEIVTKNNDDTITVVNRDEPKDMLFSRLMRYDDKCEIMNPKLYRQEFKRMIDDTLKNYGE